MGYCAVVRGPLGAGKTTVARAVAEAVGGVVIPVDEILEFWEWDGGSELLFLRANEVVAARALPVLRSGRPVLVDGNFYWASALEDLARRLERPCVVLHLRVPLEQCIARDQRRSLSYGAEATRAVFAKVGDVRGEINIDASGTLEETVRAVLGHLPSLGSAERAGSGAESPRTGRHGGSGAGR